MTDWTLQMLVWGCAVDAHDDLALVVEGGADPLTGPWWDRTADDLSHSMIDRGNGWEPVPEWWALAGRPPLADAMA